MSRWYGGPFTQSSGLGTLTYRNLKFIFSLDNPFKPHKISKSHVLAKDYKLCALCYLIPIKILAERNNIDGGLSKCRTAHPLLGSDSLNFTSQSDQTMNELTLTTHIMP